MPHVTLYLTRAQIDFMLQAAPGWMRERWPELERRYGCGGVTVSGPRHLIEFVRTMLGIGAGEAHGCDLITAVPAGE